VTRRDAEEMAERMNEAAPAGVRYEVCETERNLFDEEPPFGGCYVRRVVERWARRAEDAR
jgi:hypothetical protein